MKKAIRPAIFKCRKTADELVLCVLRRHLRYLFSFRDAKGLLGERGLEADHATIWRRVQRAGPDLQVRPRNHLKPTRKSWRVDAACVRVKGRWWYLYRAIDSTGVTFHVMFLGLRDAAAAKRVFRKTLTDQSHRQPRVIDTDQARLYGAAISGEKKVAGHPASVISIGPDTRRRRSQAKPERVFGVLRRCTFPLKCPRGAGTHVLS